MKGRGDHTLIAGAGMLIFVHGSVQNANKKAAPKSGLFKCIDCDLYRPGSLNFGSFF